MEASTAFRRSNNVAGWASDPLFRQNCITGGDVSRDNDRNKEAGTSAGVCEVSPRRKRSPR